MTQTCTLFSNINAFLKTHERAYYIWFCGFLKLFVWKIKKHFEFVLNWVCYRVSLQGQNVKIISDIHHNDWKTQMFSHVVNHNIVCFLYPFVNITTCYYNSKHLSRSIRVEDRDIYFFIFFFCSILKVEKNFEISNIKMFITVGISRFPK